MVTEKWNKVDCSLLEHTAVGMEQAGQSISLIMIRAPLSFVREAELNKLPWVVLTLKSVFRVLQRFIVDQTEVSANSTSHFSQSPNKCHRKV